MTESPLSHLDDEQMAELSAYVVQAENECRNAAFDVLLGPDRDAWQAKARAWRKLHEWVRGQASKRAKP